MAVRAAAVGLVVLASFFLVPGPAHLVATHVVAQGGPAQTNQVEMSGNAFVPNSILVLKGTTVTWINQDTIVHSVTLDDGSTDRDPVGPAGAPVVDRTSITFNDLGVFTYHCKYHANMVGQVEVVASFDLPVIRIEASDENVFTPDYLDVPSGQNLSWTNVGDVLHNVVFEDEAIGAVGELPPGAVLNLTLPTEGSFRYRCAYHSTNFESGMVGKIVAGNATAAFPPVVAITAPADGVVVAGNVTVEGTVEPGPGDANVTGVEVRIGDAGDWRPATLADDLATWTLAWETTAGEDGNVTLHARGTAGDLVGDPATVGVVVANRDDPDPSASSDENGGGTPGPAVLAGVLAMAAAAAAVRVRRR